MKTCRFDERFFESTRGRIVRLLRGSASTVNALAGALELTDNAVRAHLVSLERDGLVRQSGMQKGSRKPHFAYELTPDAERLFPKAYDLLLNRLLGVLKSQLPAEAVTALLTDVGRSLAPADAGDDVGENVDRRLERALVELEALGGSAEIVREDGATSIRSHGCPLGAAVAEHPEVCRLAEALVAEIVGAPVHEHCERDPVPRCRFDVGQPPADR